jgi:uncharacterized protein involved in response to NO
MTGVSGKPVEIRVSRPAASDGPTFPPYEGAAFFSYGFRPFFLGAAIFAAISVPAWILIVTGAIGSNSLYAPREWHVHEMLFGFLPAAMAGFILTAIPNWTGRTPIRGPFLMSLWILWLGGRLLVAFPGPGPVTAAVVDAAFLVGLAAVVWREVAAARIWNRSAIGVLIAFYAAANVFFHVLALRGSPTDAPERAALSILLLLLTFIGGRVTPAFTAEYLAEEQRAGHPASFSRVDGLSLLLVLGAILVWNVQPESRIAGSLFLAAGAANVIRLARWQGWLGWREPLVWILSVGYGWVALSLLALGGAALGMLPAANAVHVLTTGAVGAMTLAIMTRASLGHTGRPRHGDHRTLAMYVLVNVAAVLRICTPATSAPTGMTNLLLGMAALGWSCAYLLFAFVYGPFLVRPSIDD